MAEFSSSGVEISYARTGEGPPIILVHGFAADRNSNWQAAGWYRRLTDAGRSVIAMDCRGHGASQKLYQIADYHLENMAADVLRLSEHLGLEKPDLMGYSMGGLISTFLLINHGGRFNAAILAGIGDSVLGGRREARMNPIADALETDDPGTITNPVAKAFREFAGMSEGNDLKALAACMRAPRGDFDTADPEKITNPVLVVVGEQDDLAGSANALTQAIEDAQLVTLPHRDHMNAVVDNLFKSAVLDFLTLHSPT